MKLVWTCKHPTVTNLSKCRFMLTVDVYVQPKWSVVICNMSTCFCVGWNYHVWVRVLYYFGVEDDNSLSLGRLAMEIRYYSLAMVYSLYLFRGLWMIVFSWLYWSTGDSSSQSPPETLSRTVLPYQMQMFAVTTGVLTWPVFNGILYRMGRQSWFFYR